MPPSSENVFHIEQRGGITVIRPSQRLESLGWDLIEHAAALVIEPIRGQQSSLVLVALDDVNYFGSAFLSLLLRLWKHVSTSGGMMVLSGATPRAKELLRVTNLDTLWAIYETEQEALDVLESD